MLRTNEPGRKCRTRWEKTYPPSDEILAIDKMNKKRILRCHNFLSNMKPVLELNKKGFLSLMFHVKLKIVVEMLNYFSFIFIVPNEVPIIYTTIPIYARISGT